MKGIFQLNVVTLAALMAITPSYTNAAPRDVSASTSAELRLDYLGKLLQSRSGERLKTHQPEMADEIELMLSNGRAALAHDDEATADGLSKNGLSMLMAAVKDLPKDPEELNRHKNRYENMRRGLENFLYAETENQNRFNVEKSDQNGQNFERNQIDQLLKSANQLADKDEYEDAVLRLKEAQAIVTSSLQSMLNHKQLVIELDISTPEKEYYYELRRYLSYEELIPVAIEVKKPTERVQELMLELGDKAKWMSEQAREKAIVEDYPVAIRMMMDATDVARKALRMAGVTM